MVSGTADWPPASWRSPFQHGETDKKEARHRKKIRVLAVASAVKGIDGGSEERWLEVRLL